MIHSYLTPSNTYDRAAIMRAAWANAHAMVALLAKAPGSLRRVTTARAQFPDALKRVWGIARELRSIVQFRAEQDAEAARVAALPVRDQQIAAARTALMFAEHNDTVIGHRLVVEARAHLDQLQRAA